VVEQREEGYKYFSSYKQKQIPVVALAIDVQGKRIRLI
jgi:hypothetical protein